MVSSICQVGISREENSYFSSIILTPSNVFELNIKYFLSRRRENVREERWRCFGLKAIFAFSCLKIYIEEILFDLILAITQLFVSDYG
jgi:hypothetical protein